VKHLTSSSPHLRAAFAQEARIAAQADHPQVISLWQRTPHALVFPYCTGGTLEQLVPVAGVPSDALGTRRRLRAVCALALGVQSLHDQGVVHHDLKPQNVLLRRAVAAGEDLDVALTDFGLASLSCRPDVLQSVRGGTPGYMAPEQMRGVRGDPRSDLFALAACAWALVHGEPPYGDGFAWLTGSPPPPRSCVLPDDVSALLRLALRGDAAERPASVAGWAADLAAVL